jgi:hypothetical protein
METFLKENISGLIILGALGSIIGYILIVIFNYCKSKLSKIIARLSHQQNEKKLKRQIKKHIKDRIETMALENDNSDKIFVIGKVILDAILNSTIILVILMFMICLIAGRGASKDTSIEIIVFVLGMTLSIPAFKLGYAIGVFKRIYKDFIKRQKENDNDLLALEEASKNQQVKNNSY